MNQKYRVAIIGRTGKGDYGHFLDLVWKQIDGVEIVAVADENQAGCAAAAKGLGIPKAYADYRAMLAKERPEIVSVAPRWPDCHREMMRACAEFGCHMFVEKPITPSLAEADEVIAACERAKVKVAIAHHTRYSPRIECVQEMIASGRLGQVLELRGRGKEDHRGGCEDFLLLGSHILDLFRIFLGDAKQCFAQVTNRGKRVMKADLQEGGEGIGPVAGDRVDAMYGFNSSAVAHFSTQRQAAQGGRRFGLRVYGTKGVLDIATGSLPEVWFLDDPLWGRNKTRWLPVTSAGLNQPEPLADGGLQQANAWIAQDLIRAIETDSQPKCSMYDGRATLEMVMAAYESHRRNAPVSLPLKTRVNPLTLLD